MESSRCVEGAHSVSKSKSKLSRGLGNGARLRVAEAIAQNAAAIYEQAACVPKKIALLENREGRKSDGFERKRLAVLLAPLTAAIGNLERRGLRSLLT